MIIVNHHGAYMTEPNEGQGVWIFFKKGAEEISYCAIEDGGYFLTSDIYATREAAEMALIRAKCIQRLSVMAYGCGYNGKDYVVTTKADDGSRFIIEGVRFSSQAVRSNAELSITPEERGAFLYVYKEGE